MTAAIVALLIVTAVVCGFVWLGVYEDREAQRYVWDEFRPRLRLRSHAGISTDGLRRCRHE